MCFVDYRDEENGDMVALRQCVEVMGGLAYELNRREETSLLMPERAQVRHFFIIVV